MASSFTGTEACRILKAPVLNGKRPDLKEEAAAAAAAEAAAAAAVALGS